MFVLSKDVVDLIGQYPAIYVHLSPELSSLRIIGKDLDNLFRRQGPQRLDGIRAGGFGEGRPDLFRGRELVSIFFQVSIVRKRTAAFADGPLKKSLGQR